MCEGLRQLRNRASALHTTRAATHPESSDFRLCYRFEVANLNPYWCSVEIRQRYAGTASALPSGQSAPHFTRGGLRGEPHALENRGSHFPAKRPRRGSIGLMRGGTCRSSQVEVPLRILEELCTRGAEPTSFAQRVACSSPQPLLAFAILTPAVAVAALSQGGGQTPAVSRSIVVDKQGETDVGVGTTFRLRRPCAETYGARNADARGASRHG